MSTHELGIVDRVNFPFVAVSQKVLWKIPTGFFADLTRVVFSVDSGLRP